MKVKKQVITNVETEVYFKEGDMKTENIIFRISPQLKAKAKRKAEREGKSLSEYLIDLIKADVAKKDGASY